MIFSNINCDEYKKYPEAIRQAVEFLKANDFAAMEPGLYKIQGDDIYAQVFDAVTEPLEMRKPESHNEYIDVQLLVSGKERLGFTQYKPQYEVIEKYDDRDLIFYGAVEAEGFVESRPGCFCVFYPSDIHRPQVASGESETVRKVVVKVRAALV